MEVNMPDKQPGDKLTASDVNQFKNGINHVSEEAGKSSHIMFKDHFIEDGVDTEDGEALPVIKIHQDIIDKINNANTGGDETGQTIIDKLVENNQTIPEGVLPDFFFDDSDFTGDGKTQNSSLKVNFGLITGGYAGTLQDLYDLITSGGGGSVTQLVNPAVSVATPAATSIGFSWAAVTGATSYDLQRDLTTAFSNPVTVHTGAGLSAVDTGLTANTAYKYRFRVSGSGYTPSDWLQLTATTATAGLSTPAAPTSGVVNDAADTFGFTPTSGITLSGNYEYTLDGGSTVAGVVTVNPIQIGNVAKANGQVGVRVKAVSNTRNASAWLFNTTPFTSAATVVKYMPGFAPIDLTGNAHTNSFTDNGDGTISAAQDNSSVIVTAYSIADQGELAFKVTGASNEDSTIGVTYNGNLYDPTGINVVAGVLYAVSGGGQYPFAVQPAVGDWVVLRYFDNANGAQRIFKAYKTTDGTNYTELTLPNDMEFNYIQAPSRFVVLSIGGGAGVWKMYYPQAKGLVLR